MLLSLLALFVAVCFSISATTDEKFVVDSEALNANVIVHHGPFKGSCSPSTLTNSSANTSMRLNFIWFPFVLLAFLLFL
jgi:hypothetical protein